jgi:hypothetical protein
MALITDVSKYRDNPELTKDLLAAGFSAADPKTSLRWSVCTTAKEKCGKTHWALATTPEPVYAIATDTGTKEIADKLVRDSGRRIYVTTIKPPKYAGNSSKKAEYESTWDEIQKALRAVLAMKGRRTLVGDTWTEVHEILRIARLGKLTQVMPFHYGPVNREMSDLVKDIVSTPDLVSIFIHKVKKEYRENKKGEDSWTGKWERSGFGDMPYLVDANLEHYYDRDTGEFGVRVLDCRQNMGMVGIEYPGEACRFDVVASEALSVDPEVWE